jgi:hypothetical protein
MESGMLAGLQTLKALGATQLIVDVVSFMPGRRNCGLYSPVFRPITVAV